MVKDYQYGYQMKSLDLGVKNILFIDQFWCFLMQDWSQWTPILQDFFSFDLTCFFTTMV